jgi:hypothetical protein
MKNVDMTGDGKFDGFQFDIVNPFYTAEPVSSVKDLLLKIDGEKVSSEKVGLIVRDQRIRIRDAPTIYGSIDSLDISLLPPSMERTSSSPDTH